MLRMINPSLIIKDHFKTLRSNRNNKILWSDIIFLCGTPAIASAGIVVAKWRMAGVSNLLAALALLAGLLFNLLVLMFDVARKAAAGTGGQTSQNLKFVLTQQLQANVTYALFVSLMAVLVLGAESSTGSERMPVWTSAILAYLLIHFTLTLFMILKRIKSVFDNEFR
ncbi:hypothetical protein ACIQF6_07595 [Kitasatospora sp. NPDC092948]|uniref:hypothetical protein n=1 Tax=Kitasatospora sp. NPDC092948 TaxID=3364088 RepID=UPI00382D4C8A